MIQRTIEAKIRLGLSFQPAVVILGPRQVGKTTLVKNLHTSLEKETVYFDLENPIDLAKFRNDATSFLESLSDKTVILDEIQNLPELFPSIRGLIDRKREPARFIFLGSASFTLLKNTSESLAGRVSYFDMTPFTIFELKGHPNLKNHWLWGGFPDSFLAPNEEIQTLWMNSFVRTYLERDLPLLGLDASPALSRRMLMMIASIQGGQLNQAMLANSLAIRANLVSKYLDFLEHSFLIRRIQPYFTNIGKRLTKSPKIYIRDSGILHHLLSINNIQMLLGHIVAGGSWEGYVIEQIYSILSFHELPFYYRTADGAELDLVIEQQLKITLAIEIKLSNAPTLSKGNTVALNDLGNPPLLVVTPSADDYQMREGVFVCSVHTLEKNIQKFLKNL